jgi:CBS domain-containing protein
MQTIAREVMSPEVLTAKEGTPLEEALKVLVTNKITGLPIVNATGQLVGVVSEFDVLRQLSAAEKLDSSVFSKPIEFTREVQTVADTTPLPEIVKLIVESRFRRLPVLDKDRKLIGIITRRDLMRLYYYRAKLT